MKEILGSPPFSPHATIMPVQNYRLRFLRLLVAAVLSFCFLSLTLLTPHHGAATS